MTPQRALDAVRIGCVRYLNARPLLHGYPGAVLLDHPAQLATKLRTGELDVALVPIFELLNHPGYEVVDGVSISSRGPVFSVFLAHQGPLSEVKEIALDPASLTSAHLLRCLLAEFHQLEPRYVFSGEAAAQLWIGNQAIGFRRRHGSARQYLDLGEEWTRQTGLPCVYAVWLLRPGLPNAAAIAGELRDLRRHGLEELETIIASSSEWDADFRRKYLGNHIRYDLGDGEKAGIARFGELLFKHHLIDRPPSAPTFV